MRLADLFEFQKKSTIKAGMGQPNGQYAFYTSSDTKRLFLDEANYNCEAVILGTGGMPSCNYHNGRFATSTDTFVLTAIGNVLPKFLYYFLRHADFAILKQGFHGAGLQHISKEYVSEIDVPVLSITEQQRIIEILDKLNSIISLANQRLLWYDELVKSRFIELFGTIHDNKFGHEIKTLQDVCEQIKDGTHQTPTYTDDSVNGYKFLSSKDVTTGKIDWAHLKYIPAELHKELYARISPRKGDILLAKNGTTGIAAIVDRDEIFDIYVSLALLRPIEINSVYLWAAINSVETKQQFDSSLKGIGVPNLHLGEIKKAKVIVPPMDEQKRFAAFVERTDKSKLATTETLKYLEELKAALMSQYFG